MGSQIPELNNNVNIGTLSKNILSFHPLYLADIDTLLFQPENPVPAVSVDCDGDVLLRVDPKTLEVVGVEIEDFEGYFIVKYPAFAPIWKQMKGKIKKDQCKNETLDTFLTIVQELLSELVSKDCDIKLTSSPLVGQSALL